MGSVQFPRDSSGTRANSAVLLVTSVSAAARAWAAISKSRAYGMELVWPPLEIKQNIRHEVRLLGTLLGDVIREQSGDTLFHTVETLEQFVARDTINGISAGLRNTG